MEPVVHLERTAATDPTLVSTRQEMWAIGPVLIYSAARDLLAILAMIVAEGLRPALRTKR